jgi:hypothetical protein
MLAAKPTLITAEFADRGLNWRQVRQNRTSQTDLSH